MADIVTFGHACFRIRGRDGIVICDPYAPTIGLDMGRPTAHIATISTRTDAHNHVAAVRPVRDKLFLVDGPGEYEVSNILITGVRTHSKEPAAPPAEHLRFNTVYVIHIDDIAFCHLGSLGHELSQPQLEAIGNVDVLFLPVGGGAALEPSEAVGVISQLEPRIVIPMSYALPGLALASPLAPLDKFTHELGLKDEERHEKLTITPSSLPAEGSETKTMLMQPSQS